MDGKEPHWLAVRLAALAPAGMEDKGASQTPAGSPAPPVIPLGEIKD